MRKVAMSAKFGRNFPTLGRSGLSTRRHERERLMFIAAGGLAFSLIVIFFVIFSFRAADAKQETVSAGEPVQSVLGTITLFAPDRLIRSGTSLSEVAFKEVYWPRNRVPEGAVRDMAELRGQYAKIDLPAGMPIQQMYLTKEPALATLPLTPGNRAIAIAVDETSGIEGHALPGTRVDVILTYTEEGKLTSKVIVQNARVLSYGGDMTPGYQRMGADRGGSARRGNSTITLDVSPKDALSIQTARQLGRLSLVMRSSDDDKSPSVVEIGQNDIDGSVANSKNNAGKRACSRGHMKMEGKEFVVDCDGTISQVLKGDIP